MGRGCLRLPEARGILRLAYKILREAGVARYQASMLAGGEYFVVKEYSVTLDSLILQPLGYPDVGRYRGPLLFAPRPWRRYCKWHSGPLDRRDLPWRRIYCTEAVQGEHEYCRQHRRSERFLYDLCMGLKGERALEACRELDRRVKAEYTVYLLVQYGGHLKVGSTRSWRILERVAEQPHSAATTLATFDSALSARRAEMAVSREGIASEHRPRSGRHRRLPPPGAAAATLSDAAQRASKLLGVEWGGEIFRVIPPEPPSRPVRAEGLDLGGAPFRVKGYWGGMLLIERVPDGAVLWVDERSILHTDAVLYREDELSLGE